MDVPPVFGIARHRWQLVDDAIAQDQATRLQAFAIVGDHAELVDNARHPLGPCIDQPDRWVARKLLPRLGQDVQRWLVIVAEHAVRMPGKAVTRPTGVQDSHLAAGTAELQGGGKTCKAAADDDDVIHRIGTELKERDTCVARRRSKDLLSPRLALFSTRKYPKYRIRIL